MGKIKFGRKQPMGNDSGKVTRIFTISSKLCLRNSWNYSNISNTVEYWIKNDPLLVWEHVYNVGDLELGRDAILLLKTVLQERHPEKLAEINRRKIQHAAKKIFHESHAASS